MNQENDKKTFNIYTIQKFLGICFLVSIPFIFFYGLIAVNITIFLATLFVLSIIFLRKKIPKTQNRNDFEIQNVSQAGNPTTKKNGRIFKETFVGTSNKVRLLIMLMGFQARLQKHFFRKALGDSWNILNTIIGILLYLICLIFLIFPIYVMFGGKIIKIPSDYHSQYIYTLNPSTYYFIIFIVIPIFVIVFSKITRLEIPAPAVIIFIYMVVRATQLGVASIEAFFNNYKANLTSKSNNLEDSPTANN